MPGVTGLFVIGITGDPEVRCQDYYDQGYFRFYILFEHDDAVTVGQMEEDLITQFRGSGHCQNQKKGADSVHQLLKHGPPYYTSK